MLLSQFACTKLHASDTQIPYIQGTIVNQFNQYTCILRALTAFCGLYPPSKAWLSVSLWQPCNIWRHINIGVTYSFSASLAENLFNTIHLPELTVEFIFAFRTGYVICVCGYPKTQWGVWQWDKWVFRTMIVTHFMWDALGRISWNIGGGHFVLWYWWTECEVQNCKIDNISSAKFKKNLHQNCR